MGLGAVAKEEGVLWVLGEEGVEDLDGGLGGGGCGGAEVGVGQVAAGLDVGGVEGGELAEGLDSVVGGAELEEREGEVAAGLRILGIGDREFPAELERALVEGCGGGGVAGEGLVIGQGFQGIREFPFGAGGDGVGTR